MVTMWRQLPWQTLTRWASGQDVTPVADVQAELNRHFNIGDNAVELC